MVKKISVVFAFILVFSGYGFSADELNISDCLNFSLSVDQTVIQEGVDTLFDLHYETADDTCLNSNFSNASIDIDFGDLAGSASNITTSADTDVFDVQTSTDGVVTLSLKDLSREDETVTSISGDVYVRVKAKPVDETQTFVVADSAGNSLEITVTDDLKPIVSTNVYSDLDYVKAGDTVSYSVLVNGEGDEIRNFVGTDEIDNGQSYLPGSYWAEVDETWAPASDYFTLETNEDGDIVVRNTKPFDERILIHYQTMVTANQVDYNTDFTAKYNCLAPELVSDRLYFDQAGESSIESISGTIQIKNTDSTDQTLNGSEFDIVDSSGNLVDHLVVSDNGVVTTNPLSLDTYTITQTKAPANYQLDTTPKTIELTAADKDQEIEFVNKKVEAEKVETGNLVIKNVDQDGNPISGGNYQIIDSSGDIVKNVATSTKGTVEVTDLKTGTYTIKETKSVYGYQPVTEQKQATVSSDVTNQVKFVSSIDEAYYVQIHLTGAGGAALGDVMFGIYDEEGNLVETVVTDENGNATSQILPEGKYYIKQLSAIDGYVLSDDVYWFEIGSNNQVIEYQIENKQIADEQDTKQPPTKQSKQSNEPVAEQPVTAEQVESPSQQPVNQLVKTGSPTLLVLAVLTGSLIGVSVIRRMKLI